MIVYGVDEALRWQLRVSSFIHAVRCTPHAARPMTLVAPVCADMHIASFAPASGQSIHFCVLAHCWGLHATACRRTLAANAAAGSAPGTRQGSHVCRGVLGDRRHVPGRWTGSVLDSVVGVFLTQNVTDALSSKVGTLASCLHGWPKRIGRYFCG